MWFNSERVNWHPKARFPRSVHFPACFDATRATESTNFGPQVSERAGLCLYLHTHTQCTNHLSLKRRTMPDWMALARKGKHVRIGPLSKSDWTARYANENEDVPTGIARHRSAPRCENKYVEGGKARPSMFNDCSSSAIIDAHGFTESERGYGERKFVWTLQLHGGGSIFMNGRRYRVL